uniref:Protein kinase domain-containing protein n=1 Tax=Oryza barthii TaxID=65489 RepID=A0A0D3F0W8_9ORYZ
MAARLNFRVGYRDIFDSVFALTCWFLWKECNARVFEQKFRSTEHLVSDITEETIVWRTAGVFTSCNGDKITWERPSDVVGISLEKSKGRTFTYSRGDVATELVVPKIKNSKRCRAAAEGGRSPLRRLKLTSRTTMLPEDINSAGRLPDRELYDRLRRDKLVSSPSDVEVPAFPLLLVIIILSTVMISSSDAYYQSCRCLGDGKNNQTSCDQAIDDSIKGSGQLIFRRIQPPITSVAFNVSFIGSLAFILRPVPAGGEYSNNSDAYGSLVFSGNTYNKTTTIITHSDYCSTADSSTNVFVEMGALETVSSFAFGVNITISRKASNIQIVQGNNYTISVWIDYNRAAEAADRSISVFVAKAGETKPKEAIIVNKDDNISKGATLQGCIFSSMDLQHQISDMNVTFAYGQHVSHSPSRSLPTILASVLGPAGGAAIAAAVTWLYFNSSYRRWKKDFDQLAKSMQSLPGVPVKISFTDIRKATNNFHDTMKLGSGAFGAVYRCKLQSLKGQPTMEVAVKKFTRADTRSYQDFLAEVSIINRLRHKSIVPLIGWSYNKGEPLLIYEYMPNGSLDRHIFARTDQLHGGHHTTIRQWDTRYNIVRDIATGLHYVHHEYEPKVLHRDIKASNILLDSNFRARLGDFGLACTVAVDRSSVSCGVAGTFGYIAPDYAINLKATQQTDVYAFGVLVLEIVTGKKAMLMNDAQFGHITDWVWHLHQRGRLLEAVDGVLGTAGHGELDIEEARRLLLLGLACSNPNPSDRPTMVVAVQVIAKLAPAPDVPLEKPTVVSPRGRRRPPMDVDSDLADKGKPTQMDLEDQECSEFVEFSAPQLTIMGEAATPARQEDVVQVAEITWERPSDVVGISLEKSKGRTFTYSRGDVATELVVPKIKNSKRWRIAAEGGRSPLRRLKLTSRTTMLPEDISSAGKPPDRELYDRLRRDKLVSSPSDGAICPSRPLEVRRTSMTAPSSLQVMPSHTQQFVPFCHDMAMPPSCDSSARNRRRELFSCSTQAMAEVATMRSSSNNAAVARPEYGIASLLLHGECGVICMNSLIPAICIVEVPVFPFLSWSVQQLIEDAENRISARTRQRLGMKLHFSHKNSMTKMQELQLLLVLAALVLLSFLSPATSCTEQEKSSLLQFLRELSPDSSSKLSRSWQSGTSCCTWEGIACGSNGTVTELSLPSMALEGPISVSIANLTGLRRLDLSYNSLSGELPPELISSASVAFLDVSFNRLNGELQESSPSLPHHPLQVLNISHNFFAGEFPSTIWEKSDLVAINASHNTFSGALPSSFCISSPSFAVLDLSYNLFSGSIPAEIGKCSSLRVLKASNNEINGSLPDELFDASMLEHLSFLKNGLEGELDGKQITKLKNIVVLDLGSNNFIDDIPGSIGQLKRLEELHLDYNRMSGELPSALGNCTNLKIINLKYNNFRGELLKVNFSGLPNLKVLDLESNNCHQEVPLADPPELSPRIGNLKSLLFLSLSNNSFVNIANVIHALKNSRKINTLIIGTNFKGETMPEDIATTDGFQSLQVLSIPSCSLSGKIPLWLSKLSKLEVLDLSKNQLTGSLPDWIHGLNFLYFIDISNNKLTGDLPTAIMLMPMLQSDKVATQLDPRAFEQPVYARPSLTYGKNNALPAMLNLANNELTGAISSEVGRLKSLTLLNLSFNSLSGQIPQQLFDLTNLQVVDLSNNHLSGSIPPGLNNLHFLTTFDASNNDLEGWIPAGVQSSYPYDFSGNPKLCDPTLTRTCDSAEAPPVSTLTGEETTPKTVFAIAFGAFFCLGVVYDQAVLSRFFG